MARSSLARIAAFREWILRRGRSDYRSADGRDDKPFCGADSYPGLVSLARFRERLPLVAFLLLLVVCLLLLGVACACFTDHPMQALERALAAIPALPALLEVWSFVALVALGSAVLLIETRARARAPSPALLQRFLL